MKQELKAKIKELLDDANKSKREYLSLDNDPLYHYYAGKVVAFSRCLEIIEGMEEVDPDEILDDLETILFLDCNCDSEETEDGIGEKSIIEAHSSSDYQRKKALEYLRGKLNA